VDDRDKKMNPAQRFHVESIEQYRFLTDTLAFEGPNVAGDVIGYHAGKHSVYVMHNESGKRVITVVTRPIDGTTRRAELACLYATAGLGPAQEVRAGAGTSRLVAAAIVTQVSALKLVLPYLDGAAGNRLMEACHARY
jgi:hypothetical protein